MNDSRPGKSPAKLFNELRRRRIPETVVIYAAGAWALIEVATTLFPVFGLPEFATKVLVIGTIAAFPVVMALSWTFDISLKGLVRTDKASTSEIAANFDFSTVSKQSIAVLPFVNMTGDAGNDYFGDGLSEELLNLLAKRRNLKVAARTSSFAFRGKDSDIRTVGGLLGVWHVLEGSVRQAAKRIRITAQLIEAPTGYHLWSETFDRTFDDIFAIQDEISGAISEALHLAMKEKLQEPRGADELPTDSIDAYQYFLRANYLYQRRGAAAISGAITALNTAIELDPDYARAYARLAAAEAVLHEYNSEPREEAFVRAESHARKAISLESSLGEPHAVLGYMDLRLWNWVSAERHIKRAIELDESLPVPHQWYSNFLNDVARHDDAHQEATAAVTLDPLSPSANNVLAFTALFRGDDDTARKHVAITRKYGLGGSVPDYVDLILALRSGDFDGAIQTWSAHLKHCKLESDWLRPVVEAAADVSSMPKAIEALERALTEGHIDASHAFFHYALLGQPQAFLIAGTLLADHRLTHAWLMLPEAKALRNDPGFESLMNEMGISDYWQIHKGQKN